MIGPLREQLGDAFDKLHRRENRRRPRRHHHRRTRSAKASMPFKPGSLDAVVHCAGMVNFEASLAKAIDVNTTGVANVIEFCRKHRRRDDARVDLLRRRHRRRPSLRRRHPGELVPERQRNRFNCTARFATRWPPSSASKPSRAISCVRPSFNDSRTTMTESTARVSRRASAQAMGRGASQGSRRKARADLGMAQHVQLHQEPRRAVGVRGARHPRRHGRAPRDHRKRAAPIRSPDGIRASTPARR